MCKVLRRVAGAIYLLVFLRGHHPLMELTTVDTACLARKQLRKWGGCGNLR